MARSTRLDPDALAATLLRQHNVLTRDQAEAAGVTKAALRHRLRPQGPWQVLLPGVYLALTGAASIDQRDMAALLYAGPQSIITAQSALRRHGLAASRTDAVDILAPVSVQRRGCGFVRIQRTSRLPERACSDGDIRFTTVDRAVADAARMMSSAREVTALLAAAVQRRRCSIQALAEELAAGPACGSALLRHALTEVSSGIRSIAEADFRRLIQRAQLPMPMFNARLYDGPTLLAVVDAWWPEAGVVAEVDSREWHLAPEDWEHTMRRHAQLSARGLVVLHFSPRQLKNEPDRVVATVRATLAAAAAARRRPVSVQAFPASA
ncbi:MAG TPA: hypothetical protein VIK57_15835 [Streptosporangiaceae bacterium]